MDYNIRFLKKETKRFISYPVKYGEHYGIEHFIYEHSNRIDIIMIVKNYVLQNKTISREKVEEVLFKMKTSYHGIYSLIWNIANPNMQGHSAVYYSEFYKLKGSLDLEVKDCRIIIEEFKNALLKSFESEYRDFIFKSLIIIPGMNKDVIGLILKTIT